MRCGRLGSILFLLHAAGASAADGPPLALTPAEAHDPAPVLQQLTDANAHTYERFLAAYDAWVAAHPDDVAAGLARCRFMEGAGWDDEDDAPLHQAAFEECLETLEHRFPNEPSVVLARLEDSWGDDAIERARAIVDGKQTWSNEDVARIYERLMELYQDRDDDEAAGRAAEMAVLHDPSLDLSLPLARYWREKGNDAEALRALTAQLDAPASTWDLGRKANLLADLEAWEPAARLYAELAEHDDEWRIDHIRWGKTLEAVGDVDGARAQYALAVEEDADDEGDARRRLFLIELAHGDAASAADAYERFRDTGAEVDLVLQYRLQLARAHPSAPWHARDAAGLVLPLVLVVLALAAPGVWILPVHYIGLLRRARHPDAPRQQTRFGLWHCWIAESTPLLIGFAFLYYLLLQSAASFLDEDLGEFLLGNVPALARGASLALVASFASLLLVMRPRDYLLVLRTHWSAVRTILVPLGVVAVLWLVVALPLDEFVELVREVQNIEPTLTEEIILAVGATYGILGQIAFVVLVGPWYEELAFRGVMLEGVRRYLPFGWANLVQASIFTLGHDAVLYYPYYLLIGLATGTLARRSGGLAAPMVLHATNNALALWMMRSGG